MLLKRITVNNDVKLDFFHLEEKDDTNEDIFLNEKYIPSLNNYSRFLIMFDDATLISKGISESALGYTFSVYKEKDKNNKLIPVAKLSDGSLSVMDYNVNNNISYQYYIFKEDDSSISEAVLSNEISTCWWDWSIANIIPDITQEGLYYLDKDNIWNFNLNISSAEQARNLNTTIYNNLTKYPVVSMGKSNYATSSLTCLLGNIKKSNNKSIDYVEPPIMLDEWNNFCSDGRLKVLKDRKGNAMLVAITNTSSQVDDVSREQVNTITFEWTQIGDTENISIIG